MRKKNEVKTLEEAILSILDRLEHCESLVIQIYGDGSGTVGTFPLGTLIVASNPNMENSIDLNDDGVQGLLEALQDI